MPLINCKVELKLKWINYCVLSPADADNAKANNVIFTIKDRKWFVPVVTLWAKDNRKLSKLLSTGIEWSVYWNEYKSKRENKITTNKYRYFLESNFVRVNRSFVLVYSNQHENSKRFKAKRYSWTKGIIKNYSNIINEKKTFMTKQLILM